MAAGADEAAGAPRFLGSYPPYGCHFLAGALVIGAVAEEPIISLTRAMTAVSAAGAGALRLLGS